MIKYDFTSNYKVHNGTANPNNSFKNDTYGFTLSSTSGEVQMTEKSLAMTTTASNTTTSSTTPTTVPSYSTDSSSSPTTYSSSSSDDDDDDDKDKDSFADGGTKTKGKGVAKADYKKIGKGKAKYVTTKVSNKATKATVPAKVKVGKRNYKITAIDEYAFCGMAKLKSVTVGKNVNKIKPEAFSDCRSLRVLTIRTIKLKAKNVKRCFKGANIRTIYAPVSKVNLYRKIFTQKNTGNKRKITVKAK